AESQWRRHLLLGDVDRARATGDALPTRTGRCWSSAGQPAQRGGGVGDGRRPLGCRAAAPGAAAASGATANTAGATPATSALFAFGQAGQLGLALLGHPLDVLTLDLDDLDDEPDLAGRRTRFTRPRRGPDDRLGLIALLLDPAAAVQNDDGESRHHSQQADPPASAHLSRSPGVADRRPAAVRTRWS